MEHELGLQNIDLKKASDLKIDKGLVYVVYNKYKSFMLPLAVLALSIIILFVVVFPQISQYFSSRDQLTQETNKLDVLTNNYNFLANMDETKVDNDFNLIRQTLPPGKDFLGIMTAVSVASSKAGISINNFSFTLGDLSKSQVAGGTSFPSVQMELKTEGNALLLNDFINQLYKTIPLVEVYAIKHKDNKAVINMQFYYKPFPPQSVSDENPIVQLSAKDKQLLADLYTWNNVSGVNVNTNLTASVSASINSLVATSSSQTTYSPF
jgi:hypothetical protein